MPSSIKLRKLGKAPKHRLACIRNMFMSLVKYERIETTKGKGRELNNHLIKIFNMLYNRIGSKADNKKKIRSYFYCQSYYEKFINNIKPKLANYYRKEFNIYHTRVRYSSCAKMVIIELAQNPKKRLEDKRYDYFKSNINHPFYNWEHTMRENRLNDLLSKHHSLTTILRMIIEKMDKKKYTLHEIYSFYNENLTLIDNSLLDKELINYLSDKFNLLIIIDKEKSDTPKYDPAMFLNIFNSDFSNLNIDINEAKKGMERMEKLQQDEKAIEKYNKIKYELYYKNEMEEFKYLFDESYKYISESKSFVKKTISSFKRNEDKKKKLIHKYIQQQTDRPEELIFLSDMKKTKNQVEMEKLYKRTYVSGDESGFSELEDLENPPITIQNQRNRLLYNSNHNPSYVSLKKRYSSVVMKKKNKYREIKDSKLEKVDKMI